MHKKLRFQYNHVRKNGEFVVEFLPMSADGVGSDSGQRT